MFDNRTFQKLVEANNLTGEVVAVNSFLIEVHGLEGIRLGAQVLFEDGQRGLVREAHGDKVLLFNIDSEAMQVGTLVWFTLIGTVSTIASLFILKNIAYSYSTIRRL